MGEVWFRLHSVCKCYYCGGYGGGALPGPRKASSLLRPRFHPCGTGKHIVISDEPLVILQELLAHRQLPDCGSVFLSPQAAAEE